MCADEQHTEAEAEEESMKTKRQLERTIQAARNELWKRQAVEQERFAKKLVGKCYRYRNSYSCPQTEADYWWLYSG